MARPQKAPLRAVTAEEHTGLEEIVHASGERVDRVRRAMAVLAVVHGQSFAQAAREAGFTNGRVVAAVVGRFNERGLAALAIAGGRGRHPSYGPSARARIVALARQAPDRRTDGTATWSLRTLQRSLRRSAYPHLGTTTIRRVLAGAGSSYQHTGSWCPPEVTERERNTRGVRSNDPQTEDERG